MFEPIFDINQAVILNETCGSAFTALTGKVVGYATMFPPMYIVALDKPLKHPDYEGWSGIVAHGSMLLPRKDLE